MLDYATALARFQYVIANFPAGSYPDNAQYYIGRVYLDQSLFAPARTELQKVMDLYPDSSYRDNALYYLGVAFEEEALVFQAAANPLTATRFGEARTAYQNLITTMPDSSYADNAQYHIGKTFHAEGNCNSEKAAMQAVVDNYPNSFYITYANNHISSINTGGHTCL